MTTRRDFLRQAGTGVAATAAVSGMISRQVFGTPQYTRVRIGIVGAENSHTVRFGRLFNVEKAYPGMEVVMVWGETDEFAQSAAKRGSIPTIVKDPSEMLGRIDAVIIDHRHAKYHVAAAIPFVEAGIPTFVDKPFCYRVAEGKKLLALARKKGTPITSFSTLSRGPAIQRMRDQVARLGDIHSIITMGRSDIFSKYGGVFFYAIHPVQRLCAVFGDTVQAVRATRHGPHTTVSLAFQTGYLATLILVKTGHFERDIQVLTDDGMVTLDPGTDEGDRHASYDEIAALFRDGVEPRTHESILHTPAILQAMEKSVITQDWELVPA